MAVTENDLVKVRYRHVVNAPIEPAWKTLRDFGSLLHWVAGGDRGWLRISGEGVGALRDFKLPSVGEVQHRLDLLDDDAKQIVYTLTRGTPLGMLRYSVSIKLFERGELTGMEWVGEFEPEAGANSDEMSKRLASAYQDMSERFSAYVSAWSLEVSST